MCVLVCLFEREGERDMEIEEREVEINESVGLETGL